MAAAAWALSCDHGLSGVVDRLRFVRCPESSMFGRGNENYLRGEMDLSAIMGGGGRPRIRTLLFLLALWTATLFAVCLLSSAALAQPDDQTVKRALFAGVAVFVAMPVCLATTIGLILAGRGFLGGQSVRVFIKQQQARRVKWGEATTALRNMLVMLEMADLADGAGSRVDSAEFRKNLSEAADLHRSRRWVPSTDHEVNEFVATVNAGTRAYNKMIGDQIANGSLNDAEK